IARQVTVLPLPVSPTMPKTSPCATVRLTPSVGTTVPWSVGMRMRRSRSSSAAWPAAGPAAGAAGSEGTGAAEFSRLAMSATVLGAEHGSQAVADEAQGDAQQDEGGSRQ